MKHIFTLACTLLVFWGNAQELNQEITLENGYAFMVGKINLEGLNTAPYQQWFQSGKENYEVDRTMVNLFKKELKAYTIKLFLGTWCGDSKRETPRIIKILEAADFPMEQLEIIALDRRKGLYKTSPTGEEKGFNIIKVPTIIFFKNGKEVNRIVESPMESLEEDMAQILLQGSYTPNYAH
ncbi:thioredoxin family protein [Flagellimonas beolgyonensis]|jgi:thiol-disulfide isomerase/thioredoxin|uniref:thioredoxin family protein n=1 Tax=Flagellimonas beolgyonensis TaxID=864064 RepID=UPI000F8C9A31|nr:thioredoxin family protein [Allomuricauda beolgyonensis]